MALDLFLGQTKRDWSCGSLLLPAKQQKAVFQKIDDVRYDLRTTSRHLTSGILALSAALGLMGLASIYRTAATTQEKFP